MIYFVAQKWLKGNPERGKLAIVKYPYLAKKYNISLSTFANAFVNERLFVTSNIIVATSIKHLEKNFNSIDIALTKEMRENIEDIHLSYPNPCV